MSTLEQQHTPGPWNTGGQHRRASVFSGSTEVAFAREDFGRINSTSAEANARLIAAAPDLYDVAAAIQYRANECGGDYDDIPRDELNSLLVRLDDALAKARGEAVS